MEEKIYCKCKNIYDIKCKALYRGMYENVLNELIYTKYDESDISDEINNNDKGTALALICEMYVQG
jgi:hypothetical protein